MDGKLYAIRLRRLWFHLAMRLRQNMLALASKIKKDPPPDPYAYDEELVPVGGSPHRRGAVALEEPMPYLRTNARAR